jgi:hypothetical protein
MTDDLPPNRKDSSLELTAVRPRPVLPDADYIMITDMLAAAERERRDIEDSIDTMVPCAACEHCPECHGLHMTSPERAAKYRSEHPSEPPPSRPEAA